MQLIKKFLDKFHIHIFNKPLLSRYISFLSRDIVFECRCGKKKLKRVTNAFDESFPIETTHWVTSQEINEILNS